MTQKWDGWWEYNAHPSPAEGYTWTPYSPQVAYKLEKSYRLKKPNIEIEIEGTNYDINFTLMVQNNADTKSQIQIRRLDTRFGALHWGRKKGKE
eukprot:m.16032 g.16032  ORF g.16032 m.16032 type:complete len:94 (+) comp5567_c0_seq1:311-592(+)